MIRAPRHRLAAVVVAALLLLTPGCLLGSPMAAFSGEPYGMTVDDVRALQGKRSAIWYGAPVFAVLDLPVAFVLDTALLPIALVVWVIHAIAGDEHDHEDGHCPPLAPAR